jgi:hypothetical protein
MSRDIVLSYLWLPWNVIKTIAAIVWWIAAPGDPED